MVFFYQNRKIFPKYETFLHVRDRTSICWLGESADHYTIYDETIALSLPWNEQLIFAFYLIFFQSYCLSTYSKITSRCYFTEVTRNTRKSHRVAISSKYSKSHRVAISDEITQNHTALLFHKKLLKITLRCYFTRNYSKSHRVAISMKVWIVFRELMIFILNGKKSMKPYQHPQETWGQMMDRKFSKNIFLTLWGITRKDPEILSNFRFSNFCNFSRRFFKQTFLYTR